MTSIFEALRALWPHLTPMTLSKRAMYRVSRAIEDSARDSESSLLVGAFQREDLYLASADRWRKLAAANRLTVVLAGLPERRLHEGVWEIPLPLGSPLHAEWAVICESSTMRACLSGMMNRSGSFEAIWTVDPEPVREAARVALAAAGLTDDAVRAPAVVSVDAVLQGRRVSERIVEYLNRPSP